MKAQQQKVMFTAYVPEKVRPVKRITRSRAVSLKAEGKECDVTHYKDDRGRIVYQERMKEVVNPVLAKLRSKLKKQKVEFSEKLVLEKGIYYIFFASKYYFKDMV